MKFLINLIIILAAVFPAASQRFAVLSDIHVTPGNTNDSLLRVAVKEINNSSFDAVIVNGDLTNEGSDNELENVADILREIKWPLHVLPGNHENNWSQSATKTFTDIFGTDRFIARYDSLIIVGINCGPYMKMGDGHIKQEDLHWLRKMLSERCTPGMRVLSFNHYPIRENDLDNYREYASMLSSFPVIAHINGHYHRWLRYDVDDMEAAMTRCLNAGKGNHGYAVVEVTPDWTVIYDKQLGKERKRIFALANRGGTAARSITKIWSDSASVFTRLAVDKDNIYFGTSLGRAKCLDKTSGKIKWDIPTPDNTAVFSRMTLLKHGLVAIPYSSGILLANCNDGKLIKDIKSKEGPYVADGLSDKDLYLQGGYKRFEARDANTGNLKWRYDSIANYCQGEPAANGNDIIFGAWDTNLRCLDRSSGKLKWIWNNGKTANMYSPGNVVPVIADDKVIIVAPDRYMTAIDRRNGKTIWRDNSHRYRESLGHSTDGTRVYAKTMDGELVAVDATSQEFNELWTVDMGIGYDHAPCPIIEKEGIVYVGSRRGIVTAINPQTKSVIWSATLGASEINGIESEPHTRDLYVSLIEGTIFRITPASTYKP